MGRIKETAYKLLRQGFTPERIAAGIALGLGMGIFPIYGPVTLLTLGLAAFLKLNPPLVVAGVYAMSFVKPVLIIPFLKLGEWIFRADPMPISLKELSLRFADSPLPTLQEFAWSFVHAVAGWMVVAPFFFILTYFLVLRSVCGWARLRQTANAGIKPAAKTSAAIILLFSTVETSAATFSFPEIFDTNMVRLELRGTGLLKYKWVIPLYDAALYLPADTPSSEALTDVPKVLSVHYRISTEAVHFNNAGERTLREALSEPDYAAIQAKLNEMNALFPDPKKHDTCQLVYLPGQGTELIYNGTSMGIIQGSDFARHYFSIWLGEKPASPHLRKQLLDL